MSTKVCTFAVEKYYAMKENMLTIIRNYFSTQPILRAWVFGSYSRGEQTDDSDIDILVDFDHDNAYIGLLEYVRIMNGLSALLNKKVDLVENGTLLPFAEKSVNQDKLLIYERTA